MAQDRELTVKESAAFACVTTQTIWNWILAEKLPAHRVETKNGRNKRGKGVEWRIYASDLAEYLAKRG